MNALNGTIIGETVRLEPTDVKWPSGDIYSELRFHAMNLLARREHSREELLIKLQKKFSQLSSHGLAEMVVNDLADEGLQSDERFVEMFINARINRGYGPRRIIRELQQKGIADAYLLDRVEGRHEKWFDLARQVRQKKFGHIDLREPRDKARLYRFLQYRGFSMEHIQACEE